MSALYYLQDEVETGVLCTPHNWEEAQERQHSHRLLPSAPEIHQFLEKKKKQYTTSLKEVIWIANI